MATVLNLNRSAYIAPGTNPKSLDYLSAKYLNLRYLVPARESMVITQAHECNAPGIAFDYYSSQDYWWVVLLFNGITDPIDGLTVGRVINLPSLADINAFLSSQDAQDADLSVTV